MPVGEIYQRMSASELTVLWPAFFRSRARVQEKQNQEQRREARSRKGRL